MIEKKEYIKLLKYLDNNLWDRKTTESNWNYNGLILDLFFEHSILSIDYLNLEDYFDSNGGFDYVETEYLIEQYEDIDENSRGELIENILNIFKLSSYDDELSTRVISKVVNWLDRINIIFDNPKDGEIIISDDNVIDSGSYCNIKFMRDGILKKELKSKYSTKDKFKKRMKYEYNNMKKLEDCSQILNVYKFNKKDFSYLMEQAEKNLYEYLNDEGNISFDTRLKIINDILLGMKFAHENSIIHRDLHLGNILKINNDFVISDFGLSKDESIERSLKSSATVKNNHVFIDPLAINDFTKLDQKSDIYSIGKLIDVILTYNSDKTEHLLKFIVEKCTSRNKDKRYEDIDDILSDINYKINNENSKKDKKVILEKIKNGVLDNQIYDFIMDLVKSDNLCDYIVKNKLNDFGQIIIQFQNVDQIEI